MGAGDDAVPIDTAGVKNEKDRFFRRVLEAAEAQAAARGVVLKTHHAHCPVMVLR